MSSSISQRTRAAGSAQRVAGILIGTRADRLDEGEPGRRGNQFVPPQAGAQQHVHLRDARLQIVQAAHLEPVEVAHRLGGLGDGIADRRLDARIGADADLFEATLADWARMNVRGFRSAAAFGFSQVLALK